MLRSTNPAAVDEIDPNRDNRVPYVGQVVIYNGRPGEARMGKLAATAIVTAVEDPDHVELLICYAAEDFLTRWKVPRRTDQNPFNSWSFNAWDEENYQTAVKPAGVPSPTGKLTWEDVNTMHREIIELRNRIAELEGKHPLTTLDIKRGPGRPPKVRDE